MFSVPASSFPHLLLFPFAPPLATIHTPPFDLTILLANHLATTITKPPHRREAYVHGGVHLSTPSPHPLPFCTRPHALTVQAATDSSPFLVGIYTLWCFKRNAYEQSSNSPRVQVSAEFKCHLQFVARGPADKAFWHTGTLAVISVLIVE